MHLHRPTFGRSSERRRRTKGQGLVEFALITPVVLLLLLVTIDFGRALYGWVVLQNAARIAANFAALNPDGWNPGSGIQVVKDRYDAQITEDLQAANCQSFGSGGGSGTAPDPSFVDGPDQPDPAGPIDTNYGVGDIARVTLTCAFHPITPIVSAIVGNNFQLGASSEFRIRKGAVTGLANPTEIPAPATPTPVPTATATATPACGSTLAFTASDSSNGGHPHWMDLDATATPAISGYTWTWTEGTTTLATGQSPNHVDFVTSGPHTVTVTATNGTCNFTVTQPVTAP
jgi:hypothetical protein